MASVVAMLFLSARFANKAGNPQTVVRGGRASAYLQIARRLWLWRQHIVRRNLPCGSDWQSVLSCAPEAERLTVGDGNVLLDIRKTLAVRRAVSSFRVQGSQRRL